MLYVLVDETGKCRASLGITMGQPMEWQFEEHDWYVVATDHNFEHDIWDYRWDGKEFKYEQPIEEDVILPTEEKISLDELVTQKVAEALAAQK